MTQDNRDFLLDLFEGTDRGERGIFQEFGVGSGRSAQEQAGAQSLFQPAFSQYLGDLTNQIKTGEVPTGFRQFLTSNKFNFDKELLKTNTGFSNSNVLGRAGTQIDFGQGKQRGY